MASPGYVYFAQPVPMPAPAESERLDYRGRRYRVIYEGSPSASALVKIGFTWGPTQRLKHLGRELQSAFVFLGAFRGLPKDERAVMRRFAHLRANVPARWPSPSEWFYPEPDLVAFVASLPRAFAPGSIECLGPRWLAHLRAAG